MKATILEVNGNEVLMVDENQIRHKFNKNNVSKNQRKRIRCEAEVDFVLKDGYPMEIFVTHSPFGTSTKSRGVAIILALIFGGFGFHMFYLGKTEWGLLFLIFFWTLIPTIISFIQAIMWLFTSDESFQSDYG